jgi:hypothetical protein
MRMEKWKRWRTKPACKAAWIRPISVAFVMASMELGSYVAEISAVNAIVMVSK